MPAAPPPSCRGARAHQRRDRASQFLYQLSRQAFTGIAIGSGVRAARLHAAQQPIDHRLVHRVLAGALSTQDLPQEHRQCHRSRVFAFPVLRQQCFELPKKLRTGQQVEKAHRIDLPGTFLNLLTHMSLLSGASRSTLVPHEGWPPGCGGDVLQQHPTTLSQPSPLLSTPCALAALVLRLIRVPFMQ